MRAMEGISIPRSIDVAELSLVLGLVIPYKFKTRLLTNMTALSAQQHVSQCIVERCQPIMIKINP